VIVAAAALAIIPGAESSTTSEGVWKVIDGTGSQTWANNPSPIILNNGDTLTLKASAGDPIGFREIRIAANANVTIYGDVSKTFSNVCIKDGADTTAHNVNITNLKIIAPAGVASGYTHKAGVLNLTGSNYIQGNNDAAIKSDSPGSFLKITSSSKGELIANGFNVAGIVAYNLIIEGNAKVDARSDASGLPGVEMRGSNPSLTVEANAKLTAGQNRAGIWHDSSSDTLSIMCDGLISLKGKYGLYCYRNVNISGGGTIDYQDSGRGIYAGGSLSIERTAVNIITNYSVGMEVGPVRLSNGAMLGVSGHDMAVKNTTFIMTPGTTVMMSSDNTAGTGDHHTFTMSSPVFIWELTGDVAFEGIGNGPRKSTVQITLPAGKAGSVQLLPPLPPEITAPAPMTLTAGYAAASTGIFAISGLPAPVVAIISPDSKITWNNTTKKLDIATGLIAGSYPVELIVTNGYSPNAIVTYTVTVNPSSGGGTTPPGITGPLSMVLIAGYPATSSEVFTLSGNPAPTVSVTGNPKITWNNTTKKLDIATGLAAGYYLVELTASNGTSPDAVVSFNLFVDPSGGTTPTVTGVSIDPTSASVAKGATQAFSATVTGTGNPSQAVTWTVTGKTDANTAISPAGLLTVGAAETASSLSVKATSIYDPTKSNTVTVTVISGSSGGDGGEGGGGGNTILWVAIAVVIVAAAVGLLYFFVLKKKP